MAKKRRSLIRRRPDREERTKTPSTGSTARCSPSWQDTATSRWSAPRGPHGDAGYLEGGETTRCVVIQSFE